MTKEGLAVNATFLVAEVRKEMAGSENGECQRSPTHHVVSAGKRKVQNSTDNVVSGVEKSQGETCPLFLTQCPA